MRRRDTVRLQHADRIDDQLGTRVTGTPRLVADRAAGVAVVVADHKPAAAGEHPTETFLPPNHRRAEAYDQEDRRVSWIAERLGAELDPVRLDHPLSHLCG
jgi:hypothetical protein